MWFAEVRVETRTALCVGLFYLLWQDSGVSALCRTRPGVVMTVPAAKRRFISITARPTRDEKQRFVELARVRGITEGRLALLAVRTYLELSRFSRPLTPPAPREPATDRVTIRLRPGDGRAIGWRATQRGTSPAAYIAALVRAHVVAEPTLTKNELQALKTSVAVLAGTSRVLRQFVRDPVVGAVAPAELRQEVLRMSAAVQALEKRTHDFTQAALRSWEVDLG
jgi:hypothetical protein